jgi:tetratricopeptide (TPR) repeat protein
LSHPSRCSKCGSTQLHWRTLRRDVPVDVLLCQSCGTPQVEEAWTAPLRPLRAGGCMNCGERRIDDVCGGCGLSRAEDRQVHQELRDLIDPSLSAFGAARQVSSVGRRVLALKLASAAAHVLVGEEGDRARALRIWLLAAIGEPKPALEDAKYWVESAPNPPSVAFASLAQQLEHQGHKSAAADAYTRAIELDPEQLALRARRARLLIDVGREGTSLREIGEILRHPSPDAASVTAALEVGEQLCGIFERKGQESEIQLLLGHAARYLDRSALLMAYKARELAMAGEPDEARRWLKSARTLVPEHELYSRVQTILRPARSTWWKW